MKNHPLPDRELTRAELQIMQLLWSAGEAFVSELLERLPEPRPAYNTVSTLVRILERKGFVAHRTYGKSHRYYPLVEREQYTSRYMQGVLRNFFGGSPARLISFLADRRGIDLHEADRIMQILRDAEQAETLVPGSPAPGDFASDDFTPGTSASDDFAPAPAAPTGSAATRPAAPAAEPDAATAPDNSANPHPAPRS